MSRPRTLTAMAAAAAAGTLLLGSLPAEAAHKPTFRADLQGANEVPNHGDLHGSGRLRATINLNTGSVCVRILVTGIDTPTAAHIHEAPAGVAGPVVVTLPTPTVGTLSGGCVDVGPVLANEIAADPDEYYANVHNAHFPGGALRGQLEPTPVP